MRNARSILAAGAFGLLALVSWAGPADAALDSPCQAVADLDGRRYEAAKTNAVEIPRAGDIAWKAGVPGDGERNISGFVRLDLPAPLPDPELGAWKGPSARYENNDTYRYDVPSALAGFDMRVFGTHRDTGFTCSGAVTVRIEGGGFSNPLALLSLGLTAVFLASLALAVGLL